MTRIILVRHGETEYNAREVFRGTIDVPLNEVGRRQAELLGAHFADMPLDAIYSSPLKRALETADSVAKRHKIEIIRADGLTDLNYGEWEGLTRDEVQERYGPLHERWLKDPHLVEMPGGESLAAVNRRSVPVLEAATSEHEGTVLLASHRVVHKVLIYHMLDLEVSSFWEVRLDLGGFTVFDYDSGSFALVSQNDVSHLAAMGTPSRADF